MPLVLVGSALLVGLVLATHGYLTPSTASFFVGLGLCAVALGPLAFALCRLRLPPRGLELAASGSVFLVAWLALEGLWHGAEALRGDPGEVPVLGYEAARADPAAFHRWQRYRTRGFLEILGKLGRPDPDGLTPYVMIPGHSYTRYRSTIRINRLGFRGPEIEREKGDRFRIVALGESTTFGLTLLEDDRPWPEVLEERIRDDYACSTPVQVVNAGVPAWNLRDQLARLSKDILPLHPDLILTYHGYNGFELFLSELPPVLVHEAPALPERPSRILGFVEREARLAWFRRRYRAARALDPTAIEVDALRNPYAEAYVQLVERTRASGAEPLLATFNMAVNGASPEEVIRFYEETIPDVRARIVANQIHTRIVRGVGHERGVGVIDTSPGLDGAYRDAYVDIAHFTQSGRERLAENLLAGLRERLESHPRPGCRLLP